MTARRTILGAAIGVGTMTKLPKAIKHSPTGGVEDGVEPLPQFPLILISKFTNGRSGSDRRSIYILTDRHAFPKWLNSDTLIKDMVYRQHIEYRTDTAYVLTNSFSLSTEPTGQVSYWAQRGQSGESDYRTF